MTSAKIIADSISESGIRITTLELEFERFLLAQFNTHRQFSRSAQSSRAVPVQKMIDALNSNEPPKFMKNEKGMQSTEKLNDDTLNYLISRWNSAKTVMIATAKVMADNGCHKQFANRLLEPFSTVKVVVTATEWENFFALRLHHAAQPEMQELAQAMKTAMDESKPRELNCEEWHAPYIGKDEADGLVKSLGNGKTNHNKSHVNLISAARCARVSYLNHDNSMPDIKKDLELAQRLLDDKHLSPFEHQAKPMTLSKDDYTANDLMNSYVWQTGVTHEDRNHNYWSGNFRGWIQHRQLVDL
jgi:thymidylate synthase ThyX